MNNQYMELLDALQEKKIIAFGCGNFFGKFLHRYPLLIERIEFIIDNHVHSETYIYKNRNFPVFSPEKLINLKLNKYVIVFFADCWEPMKSQIDMLVGVDYTWFRFPFEIDYRKEKNLGFYHRIIIPAIEELEKRNNMEAVLEFFSLHTETELLEQLEAKKLFTIPRLSVVLTPICSLRCKECNNLMWKFESPKDLSTEKIIHSLKNIINSFDFFPCIELIGGEPFAAQNLAEVLEFLIKEEKIFNIEITTNATIMPKKRLLELLHDPKISIKISDYSMVINQDKFINCMSENGIRYEKTSFGYWIETGGIEKRNRDSKNLMKQYYKCEAGNLCKTLWENKIYPCGRSASLAELGIYSECPYIDCDRCEKLRDRLLQFYQVPTCGPCDYCNAGLDKLVLVKPAEQLN